MGDPRLNEICAALQGVAPDRRAAELARLCAGDPELEARCLRVLAAGDRSTADVGGVPREGRPTGRAAPGVVNSVAAFKPLENGGSGRDRIGPYRLLEELGEGGFGVVYLAERREPIQQRVALKVIKPGMDTRAVIARFEQERQALAVMSHPNIARVLDAGTTDEAMGSRPYFVMEHVPGEPITAYCDRLNLSLRERLELFIPVCEAVQHAHHKGIIHRDIKPSNILVAAHDGRAVPKVIDFGIAKATGASFTDKTVYTEQGQLIGTPEYMSPEQAEMGAMDIDTRTDVYSLGAVLYELLTGALPFDSQSLRRAALLEIQRIIREQDPPKPSTRLSNLGDPDAAAAAARRQLGREALAGELRRELDWIPLKALRKDRVERYATPKELADDVRRYLDGRPLEAGPESAAYRLRKFVRRNRAGVIAGTIVGVAVVVGVAGLVAGAWWASEEAANARAAESEQRRLAEANAALAQGEAAQRIRADERAAAAQRAEEEAVAQRSLAESSARFALQQEAVVRAVQAFMNERLFGAIDPDEARGREVTVREVVDRAIRDLDAQAPAEPEVEFELRLTLGTLLCRLGRNADGVEQLRAALRVAEQMAGPESLEVARALQEMGGSGRAMALGVVNPSEAMRALERSIEIRSRVLGPMDPLVLRTRADLEVVRSSAEGRATAELHPAYAMLIGLVRGKGESIEEARAFIDGVYERVARATAAGDDAEADRIIDEEAAVFFAHPMTRERVVLALSGFAVQLGQQGQHATARALAAATLRLAQRRSPQATMDHAISQWACAETARYAGDTFEAERLYVRCLEIGDELGGTDHPWIAIAMSGLGAMQHANGKLDLAEGTLREVLAMYRRLHAGDDADTVAMALEDLAIVVRDRGRVDEAIQLMEDATAIHRGLEGRPSMSLATVLRRLGRAKMLAGRRADAEANLLEAHAICQEAGGPAHSQTVASVRALIELFADWNRAEPGTGHDQAEAAWRERLPK